MNTLWLFIVRYPFENVSGMFDIFIYYILDNMCKGTDNMDRYLAMKEHLSKVDKSESITDIK